MCRRLQIGMWEGFDQEYWDHFSSDVITGIEISQYKSKESLTSLVDFCTIHNLSFGIHAPLFSGRGYTLPKVSSLLQKERNKALDWIEKEVRVASGFGANYILYHFPFPPVLPQSIQKNYLKLPQDHYKTDHFTPSAFKEECKRLFDQLSEFQHKYKQRILLEHDFFGDIEAVLIELFQEHPDIELVIDTARLDITHKVFRNFDPYKWMDQLAPHTYLVHFSNVHYEGNHFTHHLPVQLEHDDNPNYGDAYQYLTYLAERNTNFHVTFEHDPYQVKKDELMKIYARVNELISL